jgi:hypothetical protein
MSTRRIPPADWSKFFDSFTRQHYGWLVSIDREPEPLESIQVREGGIDIHAGESHYRVSRPSIVTVTTAPDDDTAVDHLEIEGPTEKLTLRFRAVINPKLVDGMA